MHKLVHVKLLRWYEHHGRHDLPWRHSRDAYHIWVSEIMLQQTQVATVRERFYTPFLQQFPTLPALAAATQEQVLKAWEGLGYYTRARNLHKTAQLVGSALPQSVHELVQLPGIGKSTAHAIAAFAYRTPVPILDANVKRILYRFFGQMRASDKELWALAYRLFDEEHPFEYNQAMMDVGSLVCRSKESACDHCPFESQCYAAQEGTPLAFPEKKVAKTVPIRRKDIVIFTCNNRYALKQRQSRFLNGLWGFVEYEKHRDKREYEMQKLGAIVQQYSHFHLHADVYMSDTTTEEDIEWFTLTEIQKLPLSRADHKVMTLLLQSNIP